jgi:hypothetical protein
MLTAEQVLDRYFLDTRCMLVEIAATLDRHDAAGKRAGASSEGSDLRLEKLYQSLSLLADKNAGPNRAERLLRLFSDPVD